MKLKFEFWDGDQTNPWEGYYIIGLGDETQQVDFGNNAHIGYRYQEGFQWQELVEVVRGTARLKQRSKP